MRNMLKLTSIMMFAVTPLARAETGSDIIVTATGGAQPADQSGQTVTIVTRDDLDRLQSVSLIDALQYAPGVSITRNGGPGAVAAIRLRGAEDAQTLTLIDGVRVNDPSAPAGAFDFGTLFAGTTDRVEVLRGPASVPWGSQAIGGVVNIVTANPQVGKPGLAIGAEYGSRDQAQLRGTGQIAAGPIATSLSGVFLRDDGISSFVDGAERDGLRHIAAATRTVATLSSALSVDLRGYYAHSRVEQDGYAPPSFALGDTDELTRSQQITCYIGLDAALFDGGWKNRLAFSIADINRDTFANAGAAAPDFLARGRTERFEYQGDAAIGANVRGIFGLEHEMTRFSDDFDAARTHVTSGYAQAIIEPAPFVTATLGARLDDHRDYGSHATFAANAAIRPANGTVIRIGYGEGFKAPTLYQLGSIYGNRTLQPEVARSVELGVEHRVAGEALVAGITGFTRRITNQIDFVSCFGSSAAICTGRPFGTYDNIRRTRATGFEVYGTARPADMLRFDIAYSFVDASDRTTGLPLLRRPRHGVSVNADFGSADKASVGLSLRASSSSDDVDFQTFSRTRLDPYVVAGLRGSARLNRAISVYGRIDNLFDRTYTLVSGYGTPGRSVVIGIRSAM